MTVRRIIPWPDACLRTVAAEVTEITDEILTTWDDMIETMDAAACSRRCLAGSRPAYQARQSGCVGCVCIDERL